MNIRSSAMKWPPNAWVSLCLEAKFRLINWFNGNAFPAAALRL